MKFYKVEDDYLNYLRKYDPQVPNTNYVNRQLKFFCGILIINQNKEYIVPVSSFTKKQFSTILITNKKGEVTSSLRFSFMLPVTSKVISELNFSAHDLPYQNLVKDELSFCNKNYRQIMTKANFIYKRRISGQDRVLMRNCCDFQLLEEKCIEYLKNKNLYTQKKRSLTIPRHLDHGHDDEHNI